MNKYRRDGNYWEQVLMIDGKSMNFHDAIEHEVSKLLTVRFEKCGNNTYTAVLRDPKTDPSLDEVVDKIVKLAERFLVHE